SPADALPPQVVLTTPLLEGTDGVEKMSKSLGNYVGVTEPPGTMYAKLLSISDELMWRYYTLLTDLGPEQIEAERSRAQPMASKMALARGLVGRPATVPRPPRRPRRTGGASTRSVARRRRCPSCGCPRTAFRARPTRSSRGTGSRRRRSKPRACCA